MKIYVQSCSLSHIFNSVLRELFDLTLSTPWGALRSPDPPGSYMALGGPLGPYYVQSCLLSHIFNSVLCGLFDLILSIPWGALRSPDPPGSYMALGGPLGPYLAPN